ncbi:MAG: hypothetical protein JNL28_01980 [Planctomycetes bacterium]|nr:hypothetical protein [Planctomycetota bacterium]
MTSTRNRSRVWDAVGLLLFAAGLAAVPRQFFGPIDGYDEGLLLTHADHILHGAVPYRDFYANYPPGVFLLTALTWLVTGVSVLATRALGLCIQIGIALLIGRAVARAAESPPGLSWLATGATFLWLRHGSIFPTAWLTGLLCALIALELAARAGHSKTRWMVVGLFFGAVACLRHDLFVYSSALLFGVLCLLRLMRAAVAYPPRAALVALLVGILLPIAAVGGWIWWKAGYRQPYLDLYYDQVNSMLPGRVLPLPPLWRLERLTLGIWLGWVAPVAWLLMLACGRHSIAFAALGALAIAGLPQMMNRADMHHVAYGLAPGIGILALAVEHERMGNRRSLSRFAAAAVALLLLAGGAYKLRFKFGREWTDMDVPRAAGIPAGSREMAAVRARVLDFIARHSQPDERIFVGSEQHARVYTSEMDLYFLADRRGAVRRMQFDPNLTNREDEQRLMIDQIETCRAKVVVLAPYKDPHEPNDSAKVGADLIDRYLAERFVLEERAGPYQLLLRRR